MAQNKIQYMRETNQRCIVLDTPSAYWSSTAYTVQNSC